MDAARFWDLIERAAAAHPDPEERSDWLVDRLSRLPAADLPAFEAHLDEQDTRAMTWLMWGAAHRILDGLCSDDGFTDFRNWAVGLGRETFERIVRDPDELAEVPEVRRLVGRSPRDWAEAEWPAWESLGYLADRMYERNAETDDERHAEIDDERPEESDERPGAGASTGPEVLSDERWDFDDPAEAGRRLPRLTALFPTTGAGRRRGFDAELAARNQTPADFFFGNHR